MNKGNKKKEYQRKEKKKHSPDEERKQSPTPAMDSDSDEEFEFDFSNKTILHLWLSQVIPGPSFLGIKYQLSEKKINGSSEVCRKIIRQCNEHKETNKVKIIKRSLQLNMNIMKFFSRRFSSRFFDKVEISAANKQLVKEYDYRNCQKDVKEICKEKYPYLISVAKQKSEALQEFYNFFDECDIIPNRNDLEDALGPEKKFSFYEKLCEFRREKGIEEKDFEDDVNRDNLQKKVKKQKISRQSQNSQDEQQQSEEFNNNFYNLAKGREVKISENKEKREEKKKRYIRKDDPEPVTQTMVSPRGNRGNRIDRKEFFDDHERNHYQNKRQGNEARGAPKKLIFHQTYSNKVFDEDAFKNWLKKNKVLTIDDFVLEKDYENDKVSVKLVIRENEKEKDKEFQANIFFNFEKCIMLDPKDKKLVDLVREKFCNKEEKEKRMCVELKIIEGYTEPKVLEHRLRKLISEEKIKKNPRNTEKFVAIWIKGLKAITEKLYNEIYEFLEKTPKTKDIDFLLNFDLGTLKDYIKNKRVFQLSREVIDEQIMKYPYLGNVRIDNDFRNMTANVSVDLEHQQRFQNFDKARIEKILVDTIICDEIIDDENDITADMNQRHILIPSCQNLGKAVLVCKTKENSMKTKEIIQQITHNKTLIQSKSMSYRRGRLPTINKYIEEIHKDDGLKSLLENVKIRPIQLENKLQIVGHGGNVSKVYDLLKESLDKINESVFQKCFYLNDQEAGVLERNLKNFEQQIQLPFTLNKNVDVGAIISLGEETHPNSHAKLVIYIEKQRNIADLPSGTLIFYSDLSQINQNEKFLIPIHAAFKNTHHAQFHTHLDNERDFQFMLYRSNSYSHYLRQLYNDYLFKLADNSKNFCFIMPRDPKKQKELVEAVIEQFQVVMDKGPIRVYILAEPKDNLEQNLHIYSSVNKEKMKKVKKFYVTEGKKKFHYANSGNSKIEDALKRKEKLIYLSNEDLNFDSPSHICSYRHEKIIHNHSKNQIPFQILPDKMVFKLKGLKFQLPKSIEEKMKTQGKINEWVDISLGVYEINLQTMVQKNLFSDFERQVYQQEVEVPNKYLTNVNVSYNYRLSQVEFIYDHESRKKVDEAAIKLKKLILAEKIEEHFDKMPSNLSEEQKKNLKGSGHENNVEIFFKGSSSIIISSFQLSNIKNFLKMIPYLISSPTEITYPEYWQPQAKEIEAFTVSPQTKEFKDVQNSFQIFPIKELLRIQNKLVYKKYIDEKHCLRELNEGKPVKEMMLYHGTRATEPEIIYLDKEESFNINYTSERNFLGKGTYFAVEPSYSHNYRYSYKEGLSLFGTKKNAIFYCSVLVGDSENISVVNDYSQGMKDTEFKDKEKRIRFESSTTFTNGSTVYAVYKNRRAYPQYLIKY